MKILLTGFDPFGGETVNPAFEAVKLLPDTIAGAEIVKQEVPTEFIRAGEVLEAAIQAALEEQEKGLGYVIDCTIEEGELVRPMVNGGTHITEFLVN